MKIGKEEILAMIECGLFLLGAVFFSIVFIDSNNPTWALWFGMLLAGAGVILWVVPAIKKAINRGTERRAAQTAALTGTATVADEQTETYELHRPASYDNQTEVLDVTSATDTAPTTETDPQTDPTSDNPPAVPGEPDLDF